MRVMRGDDRRNREKRRVAMRKGEEVRGERACDVRRGVEQRGNPRKGGERRGEKREEHETRWGRS